MVKGTDKSHGDRGRQTGSLSGEKKVEETD